MRSRLRDGQAGIYMRNNFNYFSHNIDCKCFMAVLVDYCKPLSGLVFPDGSLSSVILKNLKRTMAGEYSRELSVKVFARCLGYCGR